MRVTDRVLGRDPLIRKLAYQCVISAFGEGAFLTGSAFYFTQLVGLSAQQVGIGLSLAAAVQFLFSVPTGKWADRLGAKEIWVAMAAAQAALYLVWPVIDGFLLFLLVMATLSVAESAMRAGRGAYTLAIFPRETRVKSQAYMRAARNVGYSLGALLGGLALAAPGNTAMELVPILTGVLLVFNTLWVWRLPPLPAAAVQEIAEATEEAPLEAAVHHAGERRSALRNRGFVVMSMANGVLSTHQVLLNVVVPLWLVEETDAPRELLAVLFGTNTVMAVLLQVAFARGVTTVSDSLRAQYRGAACFILSCGIIAVTHDTAGWVTIALVWIGHVTVTGSELWQAAGGWGLVAELSEPDRLGEYQGVSGLGYTFGEIWAPALYTFLAMSLGVPGWLVIAVIVVGAAAVIGPAARAGERYLARAPQPHVAGVE